MAKPLVIVFRLSVSPNFLVDVSLGITLPSAEAQEDLIRLTYKTAGLDFNNTGYFEAHGTGNTYARAHDVALPLTSTQGTPAGDPLECSAIGATFGATKSMGKPLLVGSIKTNIGHMEGASGLASLVKAIYILEKAQIPPNLWFKEVNPRIRLSEWGIKVIIPFLHLPLGCPVPY